MRESATDQQKCVKDQRRRLTTGKNIKRKKKTRLKKKFPVETTTQNVTDGPTEGRGRSVVVVAVNARNNLVGQGDERRSGSRPPTINVTVQPTAQTSEGNSIQ